MASTRATFGSILGTVQGVADSAVAILSVGNTLVAKAQLSADDSLHAQQVRSKIANKVIVEQSVRTAAMEQAVSTLEIKKFQAQSAEHQTAFSDAYGEFAALFKQ